LVDLALNYLYTNYSKEVRLIRNSGDPEFCNTYWLYSDNYLAVRVLRDCSRSNSSHIEMANDIEGAIEDYTRDYLDGIDPVNRYMLYTENVSAFRGGRAYELNVSSVGLPDGTAINTTIHDQDSNDSPRLYADVAFLRAIYNCTWGDPSHAQDDYLLGIATWDSSNDTGFADWAFTDSSSKSYGRYQTYKLALFINATRLLAPNPLPYFYHQAIQTLVSMNLTWGGFATEYRYDEVHHVAYPISGTNTETTCLAIMALDSQNLEPIPEFGLMVIPVASVVVLIAILRRSLCVGRANPFDHLHVGNDRDTSVESEVQLTE
jgi:hypothetical protein